jgi:hypothetical protein
MHVNIKDKETMVRKFIEIIPSILDKYESHQSIPLLWENASTKQVNALQHTNISKVEIGDSVSKNYCTKVKANRTLSANLDYCKSDRKLTKRQRVCLTIKSNDFLWD